jgi:hypothetical protein
MSRPRKTSYQLAIEAVREYARDEGNLNGPNKFMNYLKVDRKLWNQLILFSFVYRSHFYPFKDFV